MERLIKFLLPSQELDIIKIIHQNNLGTNNFLIKQNGEKAFSIFSKIDSIRFYFQCNFNDENYWYQCTPGLDRSSKSSSDESNWIGVTEAIEKWIKLYSSELIAVEELEYLTSEKKISEYIANFNDNDAFSENELLKLQLNLTEIKQFLIETQKLNKEQNEFLNSRIDFLFNSAKRLSKMDWFNIAMGVFNGIQFFLSLPPETINELYNLLIHVLKMFIVIDPPLYIP